MIIKVLEKAQPHTIIPKNFLTGQPFVFDFTKKNKTISKIDPNNQLGFSLYITETLSKVGRMLGVGCYAEDRIVYTGSLFTGDGEVRSIHLGIDLFVPSGTAIFVPLDAAIHSFHDNNRFHDYGPTIILEHNMKGVKFYTLYGHLSKCSLRKLVIGEKVTAGFQIASVGKQKENGSWPPHLHFQIITDLLGFKGDFPVVARPS